MKTITQLSQPFQNLLPETADELAHATGFIKRKRLVTGADFAQGLVFGLLHEPNATWRQLHLAYNRQCPHPITAAGLDQRFTAEAVEFLKRLVEPALQQGVASHLGHAGGVLGCFNGVYVLDGTNVRVGDQPYQPLTRLNLTTGTMTWQHRDQAQHENRFALTHEPLPAGALRLAIWAFFIWRRSPNSTGIRSIG